MLKPSKAIVRGWVLYQGNQDDIKGDDAAGEM